MAAFLEAREVETVGNTALGGKENHLVHHIARTRHDEAHVVGVLQHFSGGFDEVFRTFLHRDAAEERDHLVLAVRHAD